MIDYNDHITRVDFTDAIWFIEPLIRQVVAEVDTTFTYDGCCKQLHPVQENKRNIITTTESMSKVSNQLVRFSKARDISQELVHTARKVRRKCCVWSRKGRTHSETSTRKDVQYQCHADTNLSNYVCVMRGIQIL